MEVIATGLGLNIFDLFERIRLCVTQEVANTESTAAEPGHTPEAS